MLCRIRFDSLLNYFIFCPQAQQIENVRIFHYAGCLNFASHDRFKKTLYKMVNFEAGASTNNVKMGFPGDQINCVIIDLSCLTYVDASGVKTLRTIVEEIQRANIEVLLATASSPIFEQLKNYEVHDESPTKFKLFPTIHDSVQFAYQRNIPISVMYESLPCE